MKIGIDISQIVYGTGVSRYTEELVRNLLALDKGEEYILLGYSLCQRSFLSNYHATVCGSYCRGKFFPFPQTIMEFLWNQKHIFSVENLIGKVDIFHSSDWTQPPARAKKVTTVHDVSFLRYPESFPKKIIEVHQRRLRWVKRECDLVIADSKATKEDLVNLLSFDESRIRVIYLGVSSRFKVQSTKLQFKVKSIKERYKIRGDYVLSVGTLEPRKNIKRVIEAFERIKRGEGEGIKLILVGKKGWGEELKTERNDVITTGFVSDNDLVHLYAGAKCFVYPSLYEGFGLPVLEAMAAGCPVVTSNISSLPEIAGDATILVNPHKTDEIESAIKRLANDEKLRRQLSEKGRKQAEKFTWEKTARETLEIYQELGC